MLASELLQLLTELLVNDTERASLLDPTSYSAIVAMLGIAGVSENPLYIKAAAHLMARFPSPQHYPMAGEVEKCRHLNGWVMSLSPPFNRDEGDPMLCQHVQKFNTTGGQCRGTVIRGVYFFIPDSVPQNYLIRSVSDQREIHARSLATSLVKKWKVNPHSSCYKRLEPLVRPIVIRWDTARHPPKQQPVKRLVPPSSIPGSAIGRNAHGPISGSLGADRVQTCPSCQQIQQLFEHVTKIGCPGFHSGRAPEMLSSKNQRFVLQHLPESVDCPLCCVPHHRCNNNVLNVVWNHKTKKVYLHCFDQEARDSNWYCRLA